MHLALWVKISVDDIFKFFFIIIIFPENRFWHFMQIVSSGDRLHEISKPFFFFEKKNKKNIIKLSSAECAYRMVI